MANGHGGARDGAGRKSKAEIYKSEIQTFNDACARSLAQRFDALDALAEGAERTEERYELALSLMVDDTKTNPSGAVVKIKRQLFPQAGPDEMRLVERKVITLEPDRAANEYLVDRVMGKPVQQVDLPEESNVGGALLEAFGGSLVKAYGNTGADDNRADDDRDDHRSAAAEGTEAGG